MQHKLKPLATAIAAVFVASLATVSVADTTGNPFEATVLPSGYGLLAAADAEGKCGEGKCGEDKGGEGKCGGAA